jgi:hypothetical protein
MTRAWMLLLLTVALPACRDAANGVVRPADCLRTCRGCCDLTGTCLPGKTADACGAPGDQCIACGSGEVCGATLSCVPIPLPEQPVDAGPIDETPDAGTAPPPVDAGVPDAGALPAPDAGTPNPNCSADGWCREASPTTAHLRSVWARSPSDVWAVGDQATVLHFDGARWSAVNTGLVDDLYGVWASGPADVWVVGGSGFPSGPIGVVARFDGSAWTVVQRNIPRVDAVWGTSASDVWFAGPGGAMHHWDGTTFSPVASGTTKDITDLSGLSPTRAWAVGSSGLILSWDGARWSEVPTGMSIGLSSALAFSASETWAAGGNGAFARWNGAAWSTASLGQDVTVMGLWGSSPSAVWSVGPGGEIRFFNGVTQQLKASPTTQFLRDVHGADASHVWAVGFNGTLLRFGP